MEYRSTANLTPQQQGAIRDAYTKFVAEVNKKMPAGYSARLSSGPSFGNGGKFDTTINFYKDDQLGRGRVGYASRSFGIEDIFGIKRTKVYHAFFELDKDVQGVGINNAFLGESLKLYDQLGLDAVRVTANIDVGGYTWARSGFNFLSLNTLNNTIDDMRARIAAHGRTMPQKTRRATAHFTPKMWEDALKTLDELKLKATQANFDAGMAPSAVELSQIGWNSTIGRGRDSMWVGKAVMLGLNWSGVRGIDAERNLRK
jgi:hypothetical protein